MMEASRARSAGVTRVAVFRIGKIYKESIKMACKIFYAALLYKLNSYWHLIAYFIPTRSPPSSCP